MNEGWSSAQVNEKLLDKQEACDSEVTPCSHFMKTLFSVFPCSFNRDVFSMQMTQIDFCNLAKLYKDMRVMR